MFFEKEKDLIIFKQIFAIFIGRKKKNKGFGYILIAGAVLAGEFL